MRRLSAVFSVATVVAACGGETRPVHEIVPIVPPVDDACPIPAEVREVVVHALGDFPPSGETAQNGGIDEPISIDKFPANTEEILLQLLGPGQVVLAHGRSGRFDLGQLADGEPIPVFVAPPRSFCPVGRLATARANSIAASTGDRVLVVGGVDESGEPVTTAELYDPKTATFTTVDSTPFFDLRGARAASLPSGDVLVVWEGTFQLFRARIDSFGPAMVPGDPDVHLHAEAQLTILDDGRVLVAGGWDTAGAATTDAAFFDPNSESFEHTDSLELARAGGGATATPLLETAWIFGGWEAPGVEAAGVEMWTTGGDSIAFGVGAGSTGGPLPPGGIFVASESGTVSLLSSDGSETLRSQAVARPGMTITKLDDGALLLLGGSTAQIYRPHATRFDELTPPMALDGHAAALLPDGSVLIVSADRAWIYRHDLDGPRANPPTQVFTGEDSAPHVVVDNPGASHLEEGPPRLVMDNDARLVIAAAEFGDLSARVVVAADNEVFITLAEGSADELWILLPPGLEARAGECTGATLAGGVFQGGGPTDLDIEARDGLLTVAIDGSEILVCPDLPAPHGHFAIDSFSALTIYAITVTR